MNEKKQVNLSLTFERESEDGKETDSFSCVGEIEKVGTKKLMANFAKLKKE